MSRTALESVQRALEQARQAVADVGQVDVLLHPLGLGGQLRGDAPQTVAPFAVLVEHLQGGRHVAAQHGEVVGDVGDGIVDLVGHAGGQLAQAGQLLGLHQRRLRLAQRPVLRRQRLLQLDDALAGAERTRSSPRSNGLVTKSLAPTSSPSITSCFSDLAVSRMMYT